MAPTKRLRTTRSVQPMEAPTQHDSIGDGPSLQGATSNDDLGAFLPYEDPEQTIPTPGEVDTGGNKRRRGVTRMPGIWNLPEDEKVIIEFNGLGQPICDQGLKFSTFAGTLVKDKNIMPIDVVNWKKVPNRHKEDAWNLIQKKFFIPERQASKIKEWVLHNMGKQLREYRSKLKNTHFSNSLTAAEIVASADSTKINIMQFANLVNYWKDGKVQEKAQVAKVSRSKQEIQHAAGAKSFARRANEMRKSTGVIPTRPAVFIDTHKHNDGTHVNDKTRRVVSQMEEDIMQEPPNSQEGTQVGSMMYHANDAYSKSLEDAQELAALRLEVAELRRQREEDAQERAALRAEIAELRPLLENFRQR
ncbi:uncharacterized protein LOC132170375 [Corylus avellana]|uniref:uncharacterized protein LOC132170375 n=1 Tax=Corylus avellana TaxID=13451 RepID=UPI00286BF6A4|nr:uncharacterized protein LOC132170375 [Corylus avellana]